MVLFENIATQCFYSTSIDQSLCDVDINRDWSIDDIKSIFISHIFGWNYIVLPLSRNKQRKHKIDLGVYNSHFIHIFSTLFEMVFRVE